MKVKAKTYRFVDAHGSTTIVNDIVLINKEAMPTTTEQQYPKDLMDFTIPKKDKYTLKWLDEYDKEYKPGHNLLITHLVANFEHVESYLQANRFQRVKLKIIWSQYWLIRDNNFLRFIFPFITLLTGAGIMYIMKD